MGSLARTIHSTASLSTSTMKIVLAFCLVAAFACTAESRSHGKINVLLKMMEKTVALNKDVSERRAEIAAIRGSEDCDVDGGDGILYWCPLSDLCCPHQTSNGNDGDWVCCFSGYRICAPDRATCDL